MSSILNKVLIIFLLLLIVPKISMSKSLDEGPLEFGSKPLNLNLKINLKFWGFNDNFAEISSELYNLLPKTIVHQSRSARNDNPTQHKTIINEEIYGFKSDLSYDFSISSNFANDISILILNLNQSIFETQGNYLDGNNTPATVNGYKLDYNAFSDYFLNFSPNRGYTIHILNMRQLDGILTNSSQHWFELGRSSTELINISDMRSMGITGNDSIFYDPTAFAPRFEKEFFNISSFTNQEIANYLLPRLSSIIEHVFVGSPYSMNYLAMENRIHVSQILITTSTSDSVYREAKNNLLLHPIGVSGIKYAVENLLPYLNTEISDKTVFLDQHTLIKEAIDKRTQLINGTPTIIVDIQFVEDMKFLIRNEKDLYEEFPSGYYYAVLIMADSSGREYTYETENGYIKYEAGEIGIGIENLKEWGKLYKPDRDRIFVLQRELRIFGKMLGISELTGNFVRQIESPMSSYGVSNKWQYTFTPFEKDILARRFSGLYNYTAISNIDALRSKLQNSFWSWIDRSSIDNAEKVLIEASSHYYNGKYLEAVELYIEGLKLWQDAENEINQKINAFYNSINLVGGLIILGILIHLLKSISITKDEFYDKIKAYKSR